MSRGRPPESKTVPTPFEEADGCDDCGVEDGAMPREAPNGLVYLCGECVDIRRARGPQRTGTQPPDQLDLIRQQARLRGS